MIKRAYNWVKDKAKKAWKWTLGVVGIGAVALAVTTGGLDISAESIQGKYDQATEIKAEYTLDNTALIKPAIDENSIKIKIGDEKSENFVPEFYISRWEDEVSFKVKPRLNGVAKEDKVFILDGDKIKFETPKIDYHFYDLGVTASHTEGAYEFEVILKEKPPTNVITFDIETDGLNFYYQPSLNEQYASSSCTPTDCGGSHRPENVVGSYAVYHSTKTGNRTALDSKNYKTGKAFHIYRPQMEDSNGWKVWGELNIDVQAGIQTTTIPQDFIDNAVYPIRHVTGERFGFEGEPASSIFRFSNDIYGWKHQSPADISDCDSISFRAKDGGDNVKGILILHSNKIIVTNGVGNGVAIDAAYSWKTSTFSTPPSVTPSTDYYLAFIGASAFSYAYDLPTTNLGIADTTNSYASPTNPTDGTPHDFRMGIYCTYTPSAPPAAAPVNVDDFIIIEY